MPFLVGHDKIVTAWAMERLGRVVEPHTTVGWLGRDGLLSAAALFYDYHPGGNIELCLAADGRLSRGFLCGMARYVFVQLGCARATVRTPSSRDASIDQLQRAGFVHECRVARYYGNDDAEQFRMLPEECRWLR